MIIIIIMYTYFNQANRIFLILINIIVLFSLLNQNIYKREAIKSVFDNNTYIVYKISICIF
jgi:hypothetical protein